MAIEIERRFLVENQEWLPLAGPPQTLRQGYLICNNENWTVRIRILENSSKAWLTLKSPAKGIKTNEFEYLVPINDAESL